LACWKCAGLTYAIRFELKSRRGEQHVKKLVRRLDGVGDGLDLPPRPPGMRRTVYERLAEKHRRAAAKFRMNRKARELRYSSTPNIGYPTLNR
jgi:hypothetical protein